MSEKHEPNQQDKRKPDNLKYELESNQKDYQPAKTSNSGRRQFVKGVAVATPILMSVASRPVWARNCSLSGQLSGNLSDQDGIPCNGEGCTPGFWGQQGYRSNSYHPKFPAYMLFYDAFGRDAFPGKTLLEVVSSKFQDPEMNVPLTCDQLSTLSNNTNKKVCANMLRELGAQSVAALQNAASPMKYDLDVETVIRSFQKSYDAGTALAMEDTKNAFDQFNNQFCPLPYGL
jgi:hypothetical protein